MAGLFFAALLLVQGLTVAQSGTGVRVLGRVIQAAEKEEVRSVTLFNMATAEAFGKAEVLADGSFSFLRVPPGSYLIHAAYGTGPLTWNSKAIIVGDRDVTGIELRTTSAFVRAIGRVTVDGGTPVPDFWLSFNGPLGWTFVRATIDNQRDGIVRVALPVGEYRVSLAGVPSVYRIGSLRYGKTDLLKERLKVTGEVQELSVTFKTSGPAPWVRVRGRIQGVANIPSDLEVTPAFLQTSGNRQALEAPIRADGSFDFPRVLPGTYQIRLPSLFPSPLVVGNQGSDGLEFAIPVYREIKGRVVVEGDDPVPFFELTVTSNTTDGQAWAKFPSFQPDGSFAWLVPEGDHQIQVRLPDTYVVSSITQGSRDLQRERLKVAGSEATGIVVTLRIVRPAVKVSGRVLVTNSQNKTTALYLWGQAISLSAPIRPDGSFEFPKVPPGTYKATTGGIGPETIVVTDRNIDGIELREFLQRNVPTQLVVENAVPRLTFSLPLIGLPGVSSVDPVNISFSDNADATQWIPEGEYRVETTGFPAAYYQIKSIAYGSVDLLKSSLRIGGPDLKTPIVVTVAALPRAPWVKVSGRVIGQVTPTARIQMVGPTAEFDVPIGAGGRFEFSGVRPGVYSIEIKPPIDTMPWKTVVVDDADVRDLQLRIPVERQVNGRIVVDNGYPVPPLRLAVWINAASGPVPPQSGTVLGGATTTKNLLIHPDGSFTVTLPEGDHRVDLSGLPMRSYELKSMTHGSRDLLKEPLRNDSDSRDIVVTLGARQSGEWQKVSGRVTGVSRLQAASNSANVVLAAGALVFETAITADGSFEFPRIPPGKYVVRTNPLVSAMVSPNVVVADRAVPTVELVVPVRKLVKVRVLVENGGSAPGFSLKVKLNGTEGYQIMVLFGGLAIVIPTDPQCSGDVCTSRPAGQFLNEPAIVREVANSSPGLLLPVGEHRFEIGGIPAGYQLESAVYGPTDLLKAPLRITESDDSEILVTFRRTPAKQ